MERQDFLAEVPNPPDRLPTLRDVATPLFRHPKVLLWTFVTLVLATVLGVILMPKDYEAKMEILVKRQRMDSTVSPGRDSAMPLVNEVTEEELNSEVELLKSSDLLEKVVVSCNLQGSQSDHFWNRIIAKVFSRKGNADQDRQKKISQAVLTLETKLKVEPVKKTDLIEVTYDSADPQLAARVLHTLGNLYLEKTVALHRPPGAFEFFQSEAQHYDQELHDAEAQLTKFERDKGVTDPQLEKQNALQKLAEFQANLSETQVAIQESEKRTKAVQAQIAVTPQRTMAQVRSSQNQFLMQQLKSTLLELQLKRTSLLEKFEPSYRPVQEVQKQIDDATAAINKAESSPDRDETTDRNPSYEWLQSELTKSSAELASLHARAAETENVIKQYRAQLATMDVEGSSQEDLVREVKEAENNDLLYKQKQEEARISEALDRQRIVNVAIAEAATVPALPAHPHWFLTLVAGVFLALLVSPGAAFVVDYCDPSLRTPDELRQLLQIPVLAALPKES